MFENVDGRTLAAVTGILLSSPMTVVSKKINGIYYLCEFVGKPRDAKRRSSGLIFLSYPHTHDRFLYSTLETKHLKKELSYLFMHYVTSTLINFILLLDSICGNHPH